MPFVKQFLILNRPLSPHLTIYTSEVTSLYSIWHRLSGIVFISLLSFFFFYLKIMTICSIKYPFSSIICFSLLIQNILIINLTFIFLYHFFNGLRHIGWDLGYNLFIINIMKTAYWCYICLFFYSFFLFLKIIF